MNISRKERKDSQRAQRKLFFRKPAIKKKKSRTGTGQIQNLPAGKS